MRRDLRYKYLALDDRLYRYLVAHRSNAEDPLLQSLRTETAALGDAARMQISPEQGAFLQWLVGSIRARRALEIGTFTGYSALCIARGLPPRGRLICLDQNKEWTDVGRRYWAQAGVSRRIDLRLGPALEQLRHLEPGLVLDFVFIDADKTEYDAYYEAVLPRVRQDGLIVFDNMLWGGRVARPGRARADTRALHALNGKLASDPRVEGVLLPIADGLHLCRKR